MHKIFAKLLKKHVNMKRLCKFNVIINLNKVIKIITAIRIKKVSGRISGHFIIISSGFSDKLILIT